MERIEKVLKELMKDFYLNEGEEITLTRYLELIKLLDDENGSI